MVMVAVVLLMVLMMKMMTTIMMFSMMSKMIRLSTRVKHRNHRGGDGGDGMRRAPPQAPPHRAGEGGDTIGWGGGGVRQPCIIYSCNQRMITQLSLDCCTCYSSTIINMHILYLITVNSTWT